MSKFIVAVALCLSVEAAAQTANLKIVVIDGEGAVNIVQQKTAVAPIVEVRDRNNLPVAGALVTFTIGGSNPATFAGGVHTLTVATNAAGRAAAAALNPLSSGGVQIQVSAAFQGQTAVATIAQTNVMTAAQAPGAASSGGGLSGAAIGGIVAAVAGGAAVAVKAMDGAAEPAATTPTSTLSLNGNYSGAVSNSLGQGSMSWGITQSGMSVSGTDLGFMAGNVTYTGDIAGTLIDTTLTFSITVASSRTSVSSTCTISMNGSATVTASTIIGTYTGTSTCLAPFSNGVLSLTKR